MSKTKIVKSEIEEPYITIALSESFGEILYESYTESTQTYEVFYECEPDIRVSILTTKDSVAAYTAFISECLKILNQIHENL
jgi:hypothetical protein